MNTIIQKSTFNRTLIATAVASVLLAACATVPVQPAGSAEVRNRLTQLQADPKLGSRAPLAIKEADAAVRRLIGSPGWEGRIPESWIPPTPVLEARALVRLYKDLLDERTGWLQRVHASLFHLGAGA